MTIFDSLAPAGQRIFVGAIVVFTGCLVALFAAAVLA
jgi:hypothetical protein